MAETKLEEQINGDILAGLKFIYDKVGTLGRPIEEGVASHLRTLLGEAHGVIQALEGAASVGAVAQAQEVPATPHAAPDGSTLPPAFAQALSGLSDAYEEARTKLLAEAQAAQQGTQTEIPAIGAGGAPGGSV